MIQVNILICMSASIALAVSFPEQGVALKFASVSCFLMIMALQYWIYKSWIKDLIYNRVYKNYMWSLYSNFFFCSVFIFFLYKGAPALIILSVSFLPAPISFAWIGYAVLIALAFAINEMLYILQFTRLLCALDRYDQVTSLPALSDVYNLVGDEAI